MYLASDIKGCDSTADRRLEVSALLKPIGKQPKTGSNLQLDQTAEARARTAPAVYWLVPPLVVVFTFIAFLPALQNAFVDLDDSKMLIENLRYRGLGWEGIRWMFATFHMGHYQPLSWVAFGLDYLLWEM